ncbi:MAG: GNAT family N-acetyltransferase [Flavobacterium sp.]|nr:MAG: GNAT family N-acetyltransferase [Flavobacterium sp.]
MIKLFDTPAQFFNYNESIFEMRLEHFYLIKVYENFSKEYKVFSAFNIIDGNYNIIGFNCHGNFHLYSSLWTKEMLSELSELVKLKLFKNWHFVGSRELILQLFAFNPEIDYKVFKDRIIYELNQSPAIELEVPGYAIQSQIQHLKILGQLNYDYSLEEWGIRENRDISYSIRQAQGAIQTNAMFHWEHSNKICSMLQIIDLDGDLPIIGSLYTVPTERNHGYAKALLDSILTELFSAGYEKIGIISDATNKTTNKMFVDLGFEVVAPYIDIII